ncbi:MAG TPA: hypothetical protein VEH52_11270 [Gaiellaceae bacterium]|nr:hypothetical protein [Gaiellaceae bacterium]
MLLGQTLRLIGPVISAGVAHAIVIRLDLLGFLALPLDGRRLRHRPLFGENKTWRGLVVMVVVCTATAPLFGLPVVLGACLGAAYSLAELPNSFVKRRLGIPPGARSRRGAVAQYVTDQGDSVLGCTVVVALFGYRLVLIASVCLLGFVFHAAFDALLYVLGVKRLHEATT